MTFVRKLKFVLLMLVATMIATNLSWAQQAVDTSLLTPPPGDAPLTVQASFFLQDINSIDDEAETVEFSGVLTLQWKDSRQAFDPATVPFGEKVFQGGYQFDEISPGWYPQVVLANEAGLYESRGTTLRIKSDGTCTLFEIVNGVAEVDLDMRRFPFDSQRLELLFQLLGFNKGEVIFEATPGQSVWWVEDLRISQWELLGADGAVKNMKSPYLGESEVSSVFSVQLDVKRRPFFMMRLVIIPLILIVALSWSVFWMERSSLGDRISVSFIGILTAVAYQNVIGSIQPHISYVTLTNAIVNLSFLVMCATVVVNLVVGACDKHGRSQLGDRIDFRCRWLFPLVYIGLIFLAIIVTFFMI